jgi:hypothetical protein
MEQEDTWTWRLVAYQEGQEACARRLSDQKLGTDGDLRRPPNRGDMCLTNRGHLRSPPTREDFCLAPTRWIIPGTYLAKRWIQRNGVFSAYLYPSGTGTVLRDLCGAHLGIIWTWRPLCGAYLAIRSYKTANLCVAPVLPWDGLEGGPYLATRRPRGRNRISL